MINDVDIIAAFVSTLTVVLDVTETAGQEPPKASAWKWERKGIEGFIANKQGNCSSPAKHARDHALWPEFSSHLASVVHHAAGARSTRRDTPEVTACITRAMAWLGGAGTQAMQADGGWLCPEVMESISESFSFLNLMELSGSVDSRLVPASVLGASDKDDEIIRVSVSHIIQVCAEVSAAPPSPSLSHR